MKSYELWVHYKQGDDFGHILERVNGSKPACRPLNEELQRLALEHGKLALEILNGYGNVPEALVEWANGFEEAAKRLKDLAVIFAGKKIYAKADTHHIHFEGDEETLELAVQMNLLDIHEYEETNA